MKNKTPYINAYKHLKKLNFQTNSSRDANIT